MVAETVLMGAVGRAAAATAERLKESVVEVRPRRGGGAAGTIWRADGLIVTNYHVAGRGRADVQLADGRVFKTSAVAWDPWNDLTLLSLAAGDLPAGDLPAAMIGDARLLRPGELVLALGHPYGVQHALTLGVVSRALPPGPGAPLRPRGAQGVAQASGRGDLDRARLWRWGEGRELLYADVLLGPGNSGGPLADAQGRVVGINAMVANGLALAVPSHLVERLLARQGARPVLGIGVQDVVLPDVLAARAGVATQRGAVVVELATGGPAAQAGLLIGDVLVAVDGWALEGAGGLLAALEAHVIGPVQLTLVRGGEIREFAVPLHRMLGEAEAAVQAQAA